MVALSLSAFFVGNDESGFFHWGPGAAPGKPAPHVLGLKVERGNYMAFFMVMLIITLLAFLENWRFSVVSRYKTNQIKSKEFPYKQLCEEAGIKKWPAQERKSSRCDRKLQFFKMIDGLNGAVFKLLPVIILSGTQQFQYTIPVILVEMLAGVSSVRQQIHQKNDYGRELENFIADAKVSEKISELQKAVVQLQTKQL